MRHDLTTQLARALGDSYQLGEPLGEGGMGIVYRGTDRRLKREVAIKVLPPELGYREELRKRFVREAQLEASLSHPHIVPIHDVGEHEGLVWFVMAYIDGESVRGRVERDGPLSQALTRRIVREVAWALAYAHARGIVHRDIKPENILLERSTGRALVTDFGIAKIAEAETSGLTAPGAVIGSLLYMAPEQAGGETVDGRADLYALGLVAYYMLSGEPPFPRATVMSVATRSLSGDRPDFSALARRPEPQFRSVLERCTAPHPGDRWASAERMLEALGPESVAAAPMPSPVRRLVRDFLLIPTFGLIILIAGVITDEPTVAQFIFAILLILVVNLIVSMRSFARRGFGWPELRDAVDMELLRQREELDATAALRERFRAIVYVATVGGAVVALFGLNAGPVLRIEGPVPLFLWIIVPLMAILGAWIVVRIAEFFARIGARFIPSLPRPESSSWLDRVGDRLLTLLFRPMRFGAKGVAAVEAPRRATDVGGARQAVDAVGKLWREVPASVRQGSTPAPDLARRLTRRIDQLRRTKIRVEGLAERELEALDVAMREAEAALNGVRSAVEASAAAGGETTPAQLVDAERAALRVLAAPLPASAESAELTPGQRAFPTFKWLGRLVNGIRWQPIQRPASLAQAGDTGGHDAVNERWPELRSQVQQAAERVTMLKEATARGAVPPAASAFAEQSTRELEEVLEDLMLAVEVYRNGDIETEREIERHLARLRDLQNVIDALLEANA